MPGKARGDLTLKCQKAVANESRLGTSRTGHQEHTKKIEAVAWPFSEEHADVLLVYSISLVTQS